MAFSFREDAPVLGSSTQIDMSNAPGQLTSLPKVQAYEFIQVNNLVATSTSQTAFVVPVSTLYGTYKFEYAVANFGTASTSGTLQVEKAHGTQAIGSGTALLQGTISLAGTANTPVDSSGSAAPVTNPNTLTLAAGDRLNILLAGTLTSLANCSVVLVLSRQ